MKKLSRVLIVVVLITLFGGLFVYGSNPAQATSTVTFHGTFGNSAATQDFFYKIEVTPGGSLSIDLAMAGCTPPITSDPYLRLREGSSGGTVVAYNDSIQDGVNACSHISVSGLTGGVYYVEATTFRFVCGTACHDPVQYNTFGPFTVTVTGDLVGTSAGDSSAQTFFAPGDSRMDGRPGDRVVVWCNQPGQVVVYGVSDNMPDYKKGFLLGVFKDSDLVAAGDVGLSHDAGPAGVISISLRKGWLWVAWNGGSFKASGQQDFTKNLDFAQCVPAVQ